MITLKQIEVLQSALQDGLEKVGDNWIELTLSTEDYDVLLDLLEAAKSYQLKKHGFPIKHYYPEESTPLLHKDAQ